MNQQRAGLLPPPGSSTFASASAARALPRTRTPRHIQLTPSHTELIAPPPLAKPISEADTSSTIGRLAARALVTFGWALFATWWVIVLQRESIRSFGVALGMLGVLVVTTALAMAVWTRHNMRLARRGKRAKSNPATPMRSERKTLGLRLGPPATELVTMAVEVRLELRSGVKSYVVPGVERR